MKSKPKTEDTFWTPLIQQVLVIVIAAMIVAFCGLVWERGLAAETATKEVQAKQTLLEQKQSAIITVFANHIATWQAKKSTNANDFATAFQKAQQDLQWELDEAMKSKIKN